MAKCRCSRRSIAAFSISDLLFVLAALALLAVTALSHQNNGPRSERLVCGNNLRQIGVAFQEWSDGFDDRIPWRVPVAEGGTGGLGNPLIDNAWYHFAPLSNILSSPTVLACPSDNAKPATRWDAANGGLLNPSFRNNSLSYLVGCHAEIRLPLSVLAADRNILYDFNGACSVGFTAIKGVSPDFSTRVGWSGTNIHLSTGNVLSADGKVLECSSAGFKNSILNRAPDTSEHYLLPR